MKIILDTDFLVNAVKYKIDIDEELKRNLDSTFDIFIIDKTIDELKGINNLNSKIAIKLINFKQYKILKTKKDKIVDELIKDIAKKEDIVATQDKELKRELNKKFIKTISIRQKKYIQ